MIHTDGVVTLMIYVQVALFGIPFVSTFFPFSECKEFRKWVEGMSVGDKRMGVLANAIATCVLALFFRIVLLGFAATPFAPITMIVLSTIFYGSALIGVSPLVALLARRLWDNLQECSLLRDR